MISNTQCQHKETEKRSPAHSRTLLLRNASIYDTGERRTTCKRAWVGISTVMATNDSKTSTSRAKEMA